MIQTVFSFILLNRDRIKSLSNLEKASTRYGGSYMKTLTAYFSRSGNNYVNGSIKNLSIGNTKVAAELIAEITGADVQRSQKAIENWI